MHIDLALLMAIAALITSLSGLIWSIRRRAWLMIAGSTHCFRRQKKLTPP